MSYCIAEKRQLIATDITQLSIQRQCELLGLSRSGYYYEPCGESEENLQIMRILDELHLEDPTQRRQIIASGFVGTRLCSESQESEAFNEINRN